MSDKIFLDGVSFFVGLDQINKDRLMEDLFTGKKRVTLRLANMELSV